MRARGILGKRPGTAPMPDGRDRLFVNYTHPAQVLFEIEIPHLVKVRDGRHADLKTADVKKVWGSVKVPYSDEETLSPNGGFVWIEERKTLFWTWYHGYKTGEAPPVLGATRLADDGTLTHSGPWQVVAPGGLYKSYWGGVLTLPRAFADRYTEGRTLALGFGGYYSICGPASRGPALGVIADPARARPPCLSPPCCTILMRLPPRETATISTPTAGSGVINLLGRSRASGPTTTGVRGSVRRDQNWTGLRGLRAPGHGPVGIRLRDHHQRRYSGVLVLLRSPGPWRSGWRPEASVADHPHCDDAGPISARSDRDRSLFRSAHGPAVPLCQLGLSRWPRELSCHSRLRGKLKG